MGLYDRDEPKKRKNGRGSVNNQNRLAAFANATGKGAADWGNADPRWVLAVITAISLKGGAVTFSLSRDGGAYGLRLMLDNDHQQLWFNGDAQLDLELERVVATLDTI